MSWEMLLKKVDMVLSIAEIKYKFDNFPEVKPGDRRSKRALALRCGLIDGVFHTLEEAGQCKYGLCVTRDRIRQLEIRAIETLRHSLQ